MRNIFKREVIILVISLVLLFFIFKIGIVFASENSFSITGVEISDKTDTTEVDDFSFDNYKTNSNITFHQIGDSITYKIKIKNNDDVDYIIESISDDNSNEYISCTYDNYKGKKIKSKDEIVIEITEKYIEENNDISKRQQGFSINLKFKLEDEDGYIVEKTISLTNNNPQTGDKIGIYLTILIVSVGMIVFISKKQNRNGFKLLSLIIIASLILPVVSKATTEYASGLLFENTIMLKDKIIFSYTINNEKYERVIGYNQKITDLIVPEIDGYVFNGWEKEDGTDFDIDEPITDDMNIIAKFTPIEYSITYNLEDGELEKGKINPIKYTVESGEIVLNNPIKIGYTFKGWTGTDLNENTIEVTIPEKSMGEREYTANYELNKYNIVFDNNTGSGEMDNQEITYNDEVELNSNTFTKAECKFIGWNTKSDGTGTAYEDKQKVKNLVASGEITLYAQWRNLDKYEISFDSDGGNEIQPIIVTEGNPIGTLPVPKKENYKFRGWYTDKNYTTKIDSNTVPEGTTKYYAKWIDKMSTVFLIENAVTFNGPDAVIADGEVPDEYLGLDGKCIDTQIPLFSQENFDKDFEIGFTIESYDPNNQDLSTERQLAFVNTKDEDGTNTVRPGIVFRLNNSNSSIMEITASTTKSDTKTFEYNKVNSVKIFREGKKIYYSINGGDKVLLSSKYVDYNGRFNTTTTFGASIRQKGTVYRHLKATLSNMYIKLENDDEY